MVRVLQVMPCLFRGGTEAFVLNHFRAINHAKFQFDFLVFNEERPSHQREIKELGGKVYFCGQPQGKHLLQFMRKVKDCIKNNGPYDVVHVHGNIANSWVLFVAKQCGVPIRVSHVHSVIESREESFFKLVYRRLQKYIIKVCANVKLACSDASGVSLYKKNGFKVINNGIFVNDYLNPSKEHIEQLRENYQIDKNLLVLGNISRFDENKNQSFILDVFYFFHNKVPKSVLILGGVDGGKLVEIKQKCADLKLESAVKFIGVREDVAEWLNIIDFYLFPSLSEGLGIAAIEAQASGTFCFAAKGNVPNEIDMGLNLVEFLDIAAGAMEWTEKIKEHIGYQKPSHQQILNAFHAKKFCVEDSARLLEKIYIGGETQCH